MARDPVCNMMVDEQTARYKTDYDGNTYMFCSAACRDGFVKNPSLYRRKRGIITRFLEWIAKGNKEKFHDAPASCCGHASVKRKD